MLQQISFPGLESGKTCQEPSRPTAGKTSDPSSMRSRTSGNRAYQFLDLRNGAMPGAWSEMDGVLPGGCTTLNTGESPSDARESTLSQILQPDAPEKYCLSAKACAGILRRAEKRGKELPPMLKEALEEAVAICASKNGQESQAAGKEYLHQAEQ